MTTACEVKKGSQRNHRKEFFFPTSPDQSPLQSLPRGGFGLPPKSPSPSPAGLAGHRTRVVPVALAVASRGRPRPLHVLYDLVEAKVVLVSVLIMQGQFGRTSVWSKPTTRSSCASPSLSSRPTRPVWGKQNQ
ncbi:hypothetical protein SORBI_3006G162500 [Sorghum bicolor]|uniref:Uncharacterized protein n=1 Tax=Sorghum bicolor TaxID=4558 RepID=A0A1B6PM95_SORBI|nr:hypothetical protein SORBI_3006G162500 [Sorghum bicolor]